MQLKVKKLDERAIIPTKANKYDAGFDLYALQERYIPNNCVALINTGISVEIPLYCVGIIKDRSSMAKAGFHVLGGVIDSGYRGEIIIIMTRINYDFQETNTNIRAGTKAAQLLILPLTSGIYIDVVDELSISERGEKGFGSSDREQEDIRTSTPNSNYEGKLIHD